MPIPVVSFIGVLVIYLVWNAASSFVGMWAHKRIDGLKKEQDVLRKENEELRARMDKLEQSHPFNFMRRAN